MGFVKAAIKGRILSGAAVRDAVVLRGVLASGDVENYETPFCLAYRRY